LAVGANKRHAVAAVAALSILGGCAHERVVWPPTREKVEEIGYAAYDNLYVRVEWVDPIKARRELGDELKLKGIVWLDDQQIIFRSRADELVSVRATQVRGLTVKDRARGTLIGALVGASAGAAIVLGWWFLTGKLTGKDPWGYPADCPAFCDGRTMATIAGIYGVLGAGIGLQISGKHTYDFVPPR
jgi:hypothetical protein